MQYQLKLSKDISTKKIIIENRDLCLKERINKKKGYSFKAYTRRSINYNNIFPKQDVNLKSFLFVGKRKLTPAIYHLKYKCNKKRIKNEIRM